MEDRFSRIQTRVFDITDEAPENLYFATMSEVIGEGLEKQIEDFLNVYTDIVLIVIDMLQRIRKVSADANPYVSEYRDIGIFKQLADKRSENSTTFFCVGRNIEYRELQLEFDKATHIWCLVSDSIIKDPQPSKEIIIHLSDVMESLLSFSGTTAVELAGKVENHAG